MILTSKAILRAWKAKEITIDPFDTRLLNPNSYNYRLSDEIIEIQSSKFGLLHSSKRSKIAQNGFVLKPNRLYLASTFEIIGSHKYVVTLLGRSSIGRLGLFLNITADLGHTGAISQWTLELEVVQPLRVYPYMKIGQVAFWEQFGDIQKYNGRYQNDFGPRENKDSSLLHEEHNTRTK